MASTTKLIGLGMPAILAKQVGTTVQTLAGVGTLQAGAKAILVNYALLTTSGGATAFILSDTWSIGDQVTVCNTSSTAALIYPNSGSAIDGGSADASVSIAQNESRTFTRTTSTTWRSGEAVETLSSLTVSGAATVGTTFASQTATAVPATAGAAAAGAAVTMFASGPGLYVTSDAPTHAAVKGSICINTAGSGTSNRAYICTTSGTWTPILTVA
jgi:hypothetical protein